MSDQEPRLTRYEAFPPEPKHPEAWMKPPEPPRRWPQVAWRWPDSRHGPFWLRVRLEEVYGRPEVVGLELVCDPDKTLRPITSELVRDLKMPEVRREAARLMALRMRDGAEHIRGKLDPERFREEAQDQPDKASNLNQIADLVTEILDEMSSVTDRFSSEAVNTDDAEHYLDVAVVYADAWKRGENPTAAVREAFGLSQRTAARRVEDARNTYGFLYKTKARKADGRLTAKAKRALEARRNRNEGER